MHNCCKSHGRELTCLVVRLQPRVHRQAARFELRSEVAEVVGHGFLHPLRVGERTTAIGHAAIAPTAQ
jgi:hypothetical protein